MWRVGFVVTWGERPDCGREAGTMSSGDVREGDPARAGRAAADEAEPYAEWAARTQRSRGRHATISRNLASWANYKSWSEKARQSFEPATPGTGHK